MTSRTVVIAPDAFKGTIDAATAAAAIAQGYAESCPADTVRCLPQADGGEGTVDAILAAVPGAVLHRIGDVTGPDGQPTPGSWLALPDGTAVVELAASSGLPLLRAPDPLGAHTAGLGEVIARALDAGCRSLLIALGGSASTDGGTGALVALGLSLRDDRGDLLPPGGGALTRLASIDLSGLRPPPPGGVVLMTDVDAPLLGPTGAAAVFGPQKGATPADVARLDAALARFAGLFGGDPSAPGAGSAGGTGYGFATAWNATMHSGADRIAELTGLVAAIATADLVITGEGRFDQTSSRGKVVGRILARTDRRRVPTAVVAGSFEVDPGGDGRPVTIQSLAEIAGSVASAMEHPDAALREAGRRIGRSVTTS